jgi:hypothetical protein
LEAFYSVNVKLKLPFTWEIVILVAWGSWIVRNNKIFNDQRPTFQGWKAIYLQELRLLTYRMKKKHAETFKNNSMHHKGDTLAKIIESP